MSTIEQTIEAPDFEPCAVPAPPPGSARAPVSRRTWRTGATCVGLLVLAWAIAPFAITAMDAARHHFDFLGVAGYYPMDGDQYLAWIRSAEHGLIRDLYGTAAAGAVFLHPMFSLSGLAERAGVDPVAIMAFWKLVSVAVLFAGVARLVIRHIPAARPAARTTALLLGLFGGLTPLALLMGFFDVNAPSDLARATGDLVPAVATWDYSPLAIAVGLMAFATEGIERILSGRASRRRVAVTVALGMMIAWLHPWQGETMIVLMATLIAARTFDRRKLTSWERRSPHVGPGARTGALAAFACATGLPVVYYLVLSRIDTGWAISESNSVSAARIPLPVLAACVVPLAGIGLALAFRGREDHGSRTLGAWIVATLLVTAASPTGQYHALDGLALPVAVLLGRQVRMPDRRPRLNAVLWSLVALLPFAWFAHTAFRHTLDPQITAYTEIPPSEISAARLAVRWAGGTAILTTPALGTVLPAVTDGITWVGHPIWTPHDLSRSIGAFRALRGGMSASAAARFVGRSRARVVIEPCGTQGHLQLLASRGYRAHRVGCAVVYIRDAS